VTTAYPLGFDIGPFDFIGIHRAIHITGFGLMMMLAFLVGGWLVDQELRRHRFATDFAGDVVIGAVVGGIIGAKIWFALLWGPQTLLDRGGLVWYGGLVGGAIGVILNGWRRRVPLRWTLDLTAPALAAAYAMGRVGCYVVGDDYGAPTTLPWAVSFPQGMPATTAANLRDFRVAIPESLPPDTVLAVHPTQLYEITAMLIVFAILWRWRRNRHATGWLFGAYLIFAGLERFAVEFLRAKDDRFLAGMTIAQSVAVASILLGTGLVVRLARGDRVNPGSWLERGAGGAPKPS
jgi:phosphatidylglycerol:prolipoprotein diacylglycerol transferase